MDIKTFCATNKKTQRHIAEQAETSPAYITQIVKGIRRPSPNVALRIEQATGGAVTRDELLFPELYRAQPPVEEKAA